MIRVRSSEPTCDYCGLPLPGAWWGRTRPELPEAVPAPQYCCFGCRFAAAVAQERGEKGELSWTLARLGLAIFLSMNVMVFTMALWSGDVYGDAGGPDDLAAPLQGLFRYACLLLTAPVVLLLGAPLAQNAWLGLRAGRPGTDLLLLAGVAAAMAYSVVSLVRHEGHVYFEVACGVLVMVTLGRWLEAAGRSKAAAALDALTKLLPDRVVVVRDGAEQSVPIGEVAAGDVLRVLPGQRLPVDGVIERGAAEFDEQIITGESQPNFKERGQTVYGGTLNLDGDLLIRATTGAGEGMLRRLVEAVERARATKGAYQRLADLIARWFIPVVTAIALAVFAWHGVRHGWERGSLAGLAVVLIACPCALGLATPLAVWAAMGTAARSGVLIQSGDALERLAGVRAVCFDKTGTLTTGTPQLAEMIVANGATRAEALARAGVLARASTHPLAAAIAREADRSATPVAEGVRSLAGRGMIGTIAGRATLLGSPRLMEESGCRMPPVLRTATEKLHERLMPVVCVGWGGAVRGVFGLTEELRPAAQDCVAACGELGLHVAVLTGDHAARAAALGRQLRVPVTGELLPDDKLAALRELRGARGAVLMVGDGVNDAPALAGADVGVALGCGADVSRQSADVCLTGNDLSRIAWTVGLARRTVRTIRQNLFWAFFYNLLGIALAAAGLLNPIWAGLAMLVSSFLVVANSLRLTRDEGVRQTAAIVAPTDETAEKSVPRRAVPAVEAGHAA